MVESFPKKTAGVSARRDVDYAAFFAFLPLAGFGVTMGPKAIPVGSQFFSFSLCSGFWPALLSGAAKARSSWPTSDALLSRARDPAHGSPRVSRARASNWSRLMRLRKLAPVGRQ